MPTIFCSSVSVSDDVLCPVVLEEFKTVPEQLSLHLAHFQDTKPFFVRALKYIYFLFFCTAVANKASKITPTFAFISELKPLTLNLIAKFVGAHKKWPRSFGFKKFKVIFTMPCLQKQTRAHACHHAFSGGCMTRTTNVNTASTRKEEDRQASLVPVKYLHFPDGFASTSCFPSVWVWLRAMNLCISF